MMLYKVWLSTSEVVWETNCWAVTKAACFQRHRGFELVSQRCWCCDFTASQSPAFLFSRSDRVQWGGKWQVSSKKTDMSYLRQGPFTIGFFLQLHQILPGVKDGIESYSHVYDIWTYIYIYIYITYSSNSIKVSSPESVLDICDTSWGGGFSMHTRYLDWAWPMSRGLKCLHHFISFHIHILESPKRTAWFWSKVFRQCLCSRWYGPRSLQGWIIATWSWKPQNPLIHF